jgi:hypothetical protein
MPIIDALWHMLAFEAGLVRGASSENSVNGNSIVTIYAQIQELI